MNNSKRFGIPDEEFIRGKVPMTKEEVRAVTLAKLQLSDNSIILDIGAGTGSISIECAMFAPLGKVYAVEVNPEGILLIHKNIKKFNAANIEVIEGMAPLCLEGIKQVDRIMIGGSKGNIKEIIQWAKTHLIKDGIIAANFISLENTVDFIKTLREQGYKYEVTQIFIAKGKTINELTMMQASNPIFIVKAAI